MDKIKVEHFSDADGYQVEVTNLTTKKHRTWRFDEVKRKPNHQYIKYDMLKKPNTRTHELIICENGFEDWVDNNAEVLAQGVM